MHTTLYTRSSSPVPPSRISWEAPLLAQGRAKQVLTFAEEYCPELLAAFGKIDLGWARVNEESGPDAFTPHMQLCIVAPDFSPQPLEVLLQQRHVRPFKQKFEEFLISCSTAFVI